MVATTTVDIHLLHNVQGCQQLKHLVSNILLALAAHAYIQAYPDMRMRTLTLQNFIEIQHVVAMNQKL